MRRGWGGSRDGGLAGKGGIEATTQDEREMATREKDGNPEDKDGHSKTANRQHQCSGGGWRLTVAEGGGGSM